MALNWVGQYGSTTAYAIDDAVYHTGAFWRNLTGSTGAEPTLAATAWQLITNPLTSRGPWNAAFAGGYHASDIVHYLTTSSYYVLIVNGPVVTDPTVDTASWLNMAQMATDPSISGAAGVSGIQALSQVIYINPPVAGASTYQLPANPNPKDTYWIKCARGDESENNQTVSGNGHTIDGNSSFMFTLNYQSAGFSFNGTEWSVL